MEQYRNLSFWLDSVPESLEPRPALEGESQANVVIVGAGYTGLWTAYYLKKNQPDLDIAIVEANIAGYGASGRNGGWCSAYFSGIDSWLEKENTRDAAIHLQRLMFDAVAETGKVCDREGIDAHFEQAGALEFAVNKEQVGRLQDEYRHAHELGFDESDYRWIEGTEARETLNAKNIKAAIHMAHTAAVHPARLARGLAQTVEKMGVRIYEQSAVLKLEGRKAITADGSLSGDHLLIATEGYSDSIDGRQRRLIPVHSMMIATEPLSTEQIAEIGLDQRYCFGSIHYLVTYGQLTADNRISFGCRGSYHYGSAVQAFDGLERDFDTVRHTLRSFFPLLKDVSFTHAWGGCMGVSRNMHPSVCYQASSGIGWAGGYFGNGVGAAHLAGRTLADLVLERDTERVQTPWVNPPESDRRWEPEPLRWLGIRSARTLMHLADAQEASDSGRAAWTRKALDRIW